MNVSEASRIAREALLVVLMVGGPVLVLTALIGTAVSIFQAVTQIHEQTLTFLPKLVAVMILLAVASGWMMQKTVDYASRTFERISTVGP
jgi:flagellar biosynthetic protein FliQ